MGAGWPADGVLPDLGLELKQELTTGSLSNPKAAAVPMLCAVGGMLAPPVLFIGVISLFAAAGSGQLVIASGTSFSFAQMSNGWAGAHSHGYRVLIGRIGPVRQSVAGIHPRFSDDIGHSGRPAGHHPDRGVLLIGERMVLVPWHSRMRGRLVLSGPHAQGTVAGRGHRGRAGMGHDVRSGVHPTLAGVLVGLLTPAHERFGEKTPRAERYADKLQPFSALLALPISHCSPLVCTSSR